jgi:hypothetical protein
MGEDIKELPEGAHVKFTYLKSDDYNVHFINGAYGGLTTHGDIVCNFFFEYKPLPESEELVNVGGKLEKPPEEISNPQFTREVKVGIILAPSEARIIAKWLNEKADAFEKIFKPAV